MTEGSETISYAAPVLPVHYSTSETDIAKANVLPDVCIIPMV